MSKTFLPEIKDLFLKIEDIVTHEHDRMVLSKNTHESQSPDAITAPDAYDPKGYITFNSGSNPSPCVVIIVDTLLADARYSNVKEQFITNLTKLLNEHGINDTRVLLNKKHVSFTDVCGLGETPACYDKGVPVICREEIIRLPFPSNDEDGCPKLVITLPDSQDSCQQLFAAYSELLYERAAYQLCDKILRVQENLAPLVAYNDSGIITEASDGRENAIMEEVRRRCIEKGCRTFFCPTLSS